MKYKPVTGSILNDEQAQRYGEELSTLEEELGVLTPDAVLERAREKASPLHDFFEWNNKTAAIKWRTHQARMMMNSINVVVRDGDGQEREVRAFHRVVVTAVTKENTEAKSAKIGGYVNVKRAITDDDLRDQVVGNALKELNTWTLKYQSYSELSKLVRKVGDAMVDFGV